MSDTLRSTGGVKISNIKAISSASYRYGTYTIEIRHSEKVMKKSQAIEANGTSIIWPESFSFACDLTDQFIFQFKIVRTGIVRKRVDVGSCEQKVLDLLQLRDNSGSCKLELSKGCHLIFRVEQLDDILPEIIGEVVNVPRELLERPAEVANATMGAHDIIVDQGDTWTSFLSQFEIFMSTMDKIAEVHPYVALAWSILSVVPKTIISQSSRNDSINKLFQKLKDVYDYITDAKRVPTLGKTQSKTILALVQQTIECAYFIGEYGASNTGSGMDLAISRQLADGDVQWRKSLVPIIQKTSIRTSTDIIIQFEELIFKPSKEVNTIGPVVVVIDGLDESGDRNERAVLLELLFKRCSQLSPNYYFVITSRPEPDIERWCQQPTIVCKRMADIDLTETTKDIQQYISFRLSDVGDILDKQLGLDWRSRLTERAEGLFQWASTVCDLIDPTVEFEVAEQVKTYMSGSTSSLHQLYYQILVSRPEFRRPNFITAFNMIMGAVVTIREPLSIQALQSLFQDDIRHSVESIMKPLHSLFLGTHDFDTPVRPLHTSLTDFLTTPSIDVIDNEQETKTISNPFYVDTSDQGHFTFACLKLMNNGKSGLRFNICNLETSHKLNRHVSDLDHRIHTSIPSHLLYASSFWAVHLRDSSPNKALLEQLHYLMNTNLLYLFEALGLLRAIERVCISMKILAAWCEDKDRELAKQAEEACQFGYDFGDAIMNSTPHLYISALPFAPNNSFIRKRFLDLFPRHFDIEQPEGQSTDSFSNAHVMKRHTGSMPTAVAFSPRGRYIATGFENGEFWLWDYKTGEMVHQWGHDSKLGRLCSIVFSPNGESATCCFDDASIKIWNVDRNELVCHFNEGESGWYSTISTSGQYLVFHSYSNGILLYDTSTFSEPISVSFQCTIDIVESIFSPDGELLVFLDESDSISFWHIQTQKTIGQLRSSDHGYRCVKSMAFFPDGDRFVLGSNENIGIWDVSTRIKISEFKLNWMGVYIKLYRMAIFPNSRNIFVSSNHGNNILDVSTWKLLQSLLSEDFTSIGYYYPLLAVSPNCEDIVLTTSNGTIQVQKWENMSKNSCVSYEYTSARLSPGGRYLILGLQGKDTGQSYLQISNVATMNKITTQAQLRNSMIEVSPGDEYIVYIATHGLCLWSDKTGELPLDASNRDFRALAFSSTGDRLITGDQSGSAIVWNTHTRQPIKILPMTPDAGDIISLAFSSTGGQLLVAYQRGDFDVIEIHDSLSGDIMKGPFSYHDPGKVPFNISSVAFSANESRIVYIASQHGTVLDTDTGQILFTVSPEVSGTLQLSPDRKCIMQVDELQKRMYRLKLWDVDQGLAIESRYFYRARPGFSNNSEELIKMDRTGVISFWNINTGNEVMIPTSRYSDVHKTLPHVASNERYVVIVANEYVEAWSLEARRPASQLEHGSRFKIDWSEDDQIRAPSMPDDQARTEYTLASQNELFSDSSKIDEDGWVLSPNGELLFWVPEKRRAGLWRPSIVHMAGIHTTKLKFDNFVHGPKWTECKESLIP